MIKYKGFEVEEVLEMGKVEVVDGMINSVSSIKSRNRKDKEKVKECLEVLEMLKKWKEEKGFVKVGKRGKYEGVEIKSLSDSELDGMYESLYSRRCYYRGLDDRKYKEIEGKLKEIKLERLERKKKKVKEG